MIPYGRQSIDEADIEAVVRVLQSDFLTQGPEIDAFEGAVASYVGAAHAVAVNSATSALHMGCHALGVGPGDLVWTSPNSFAASANCARYCGADVDFVDIDPRDLNMSVTALAEKLEAAQRADRLPKVVVPVDFAGRSCDLRRMRELADQYGFAILEDASHAIGAEHRGRKVGGHGLADITVFSFHPVKIITSAEGGMALTQDAELAERMRMFRTHGMTRDPARMEGPSHGAWYYQQLELGFNYRMTDLHAALGRSQLSRIDGMIERRHAIRRVYDQALAGTGLVLPPPDQNGRSSLHLYPVRVPATVAGGRARAFGALRSRGVGVNVLYIPIHTHPYYRKLGFRPGDFPHAEAYYAEALALPMYAGLSNAQQAEVIAAIHEVVKGPA
jgi:UDP-4-amino-4,6-dideoxy-N-acetyl-beta-L-altrosamine transaminase